MKLKSILYKKEQDELVDKIINILELDNKSSIILYNLDNDKIKQDKILELIPEIRKYYSFSTIIGASEPTKAKRPYLSIVRQLTKSKYKLNSYDYRIKQDKILELIPEIRKYYSFSTIIGASEPTKAKRPYLSIIRQLTKSKYKLNSYDYRIKQDDKEDIRTKKYIFEQLN